MAPHSGQPPVPSEPAPGGSGARSTTRPPEGSVAAASTAPERSVQAPAPAVASPAAQPASPARHRSGPVWILTAPAGPTRRAASPVARSCSRAWAVRAGSSRAASASADDASGSPVRPTSSLRPMPWEIAATRPSAATEITSARSAARQGRGGRESGCIGGEGFVALGRKSFRGRRRGPLARLAELDDDKVTTGVVSTHG